MTAKQPYLMPPPPKPLVYMVDCNSIMALDNAHIVPPGEPPRSPAFNPAEQRTIWSGLKELIVGGRLKVIAPVRDELKRHYPAGLKRLRRSGDISLATNNQVRAVYRSVITRHYQHWWPKLRDPKFDPADPWLVAYACHFGYVVVSQELRRREQQGTKKNHKLPDICDLETVTCWKLRELAKAEGWRL